MDALWPNVIVEESNLTQTIYTLRRLLGERPGEHRFIVTVPGRGYRFVANVTVDAAPSPELTTQSSANSRRKTQLSIAAGCTVLIIVAAFLIFRPVQMNSRVGKASVAVLPFADRNGDQGHLSSGISDELLSRLRRVEGLTVAGGQWMPRLLQEVGDPKYLGTKLSVEHLLEGSVRRDGERLRISARLMAANDGHIVWSQDFDRPVSDVFAIQDEIATSVANAMSVVLDVGLHSTNYGGTRVFEAFDRNLRGLALRNRGPPDLPVQELQSAVTLDPNYARAWANLAIAWGTVARLATSPEGMNAALSKMDEASAKAQSLAPNTWFGSAARGWYYVGKNDWINADAAMRRTQALGDIPDPELHFTVNAFSGQVGRVTEGRRPVERLLSIDARHQDGNVSLLHNAVLARDYATAWRAYASSHEVEPDYNPLRETLAMWLAFAEGNETRARELLQTLAAKSGGMYAEIEKAYDNKTKRLAVLRRIADAPNVSRGLLSYAAVFAGQFDDPALAVVLLRRAYLGPGWAGYPQLWLPHLQEARKTTGFKDLVREIGFVDMWRKSGDWGDFCRPVGAEDFECS